MSEEFIPTSSGKIPFKEYETFYEVYGDLSSGAIPLICLHGGPGFPRYYCLHMSDLSSSRPVIIYDQVGCGESTIIKDKPASFWTIELFLEELDNLIKFFKLEKYDLWGQSWGSMLASEHAVLRPKGLNKLILADCLASVELWIVSANQLKKTLTEENQEAIDKHEAAGTFDDPEFKGAMYEFYSKYVIRKWPPTGVVLKSFQAVEENPTVYLAMQGPTEFTFTGSLKDWTIIPRLPQADPNLKVLLLNGKYDEAQDFVIQPFKDYWKDAEWVTFQESAHMPHYEEREKYMEVVRAFLDK